MKSKEAKETLKVKSGLKRLGGVCGLSISTPAGDIEATINRDPNFPSIDIHVNGHLAAIVEYDSCERGIYIRGYKKSSDKPTEICWDD
jgi:hypothetical protein